MALHLQRDLDKLQRDLVAMASLVEASLRNASRALCQRDGRLARQVIAGDQQIDTEEIHIDEDCLKILALHQPVAIDLRRIAAIMQVNTDLERIGDLAEEIAERVLHICTQPVVPIPPKLHHMAELASTMVGQCLDGFVHRDTSLAGRVLRLDDEVDRYNNEIIAELIETMKRAHSGAGQPVAVLGHPTSGTDRRPCDQHCRGGRLPGRGRGGASSPVREARNSRCREVVK